MLQRTRVSIFISLTLVFMMESFFVARRVRAEAALLIAEVQVGGALGADDEFVELYNPGEEPVELSGWSLRRRTASGTESNLLSDIGRGVDPITGARSSEASLVIPAHGRFLIAPRAGCGAEGDKACFTGSTPPDNYYSVKSGLLAKDNTLLLYGKDGELVDKLGWGKAGDETAAVRESPAGGQSLERRSGEEGLQDTQDNRADFFVQFLPTPQNAAGASLAEEGAEIRNEAPEEEENVPTEEAASDSANADTDAPEAYVIRITEFLPDPAGADSEMEFIELYNESAREADLSGYRLADTAGAVKEYVFSEGARLAPGAYRAFYSQQTGLALNNDGDGVRLRDARGVVICESPLSGPAPLGAAFIRQTDGTWDWSALPTPGAENVLHILEDKKARSIQEKATAETAESDLETEIPERGMETEYDVPYDYADTVEISEIFPDPAGRDNRDASWEWVELHNAGARAVDLSGWCLDDVMDKGSKAYCFAAQQRVPAGGFVVVGSETTKLNLNNSGDEVNLLWPDGTLMDRVLYAGGSEGQAYVLAADGVWSWSVRATPLGENVFEMEPVKAKRIVTKKSAGASSRAGADTPEVVLGANFAAPAAEAAVTITAAKGLPLGSVLTVAGWVSAPPGVYGDDIMYLVENAGEGIQVFAAGGLPALVSGEEVRVSGRLEELGGEKRLVADEGEPIEKLSEDNLLPIKDVALARLGADELGDLIRVEGEVASVADERLLWLSADGVGLKVYAKPETGLSFKGRRAGERLAAVGHLSRTSAGLRLLPRFAGDVRFLEKGVDGIIAESVSAPAFGSGLSFPLRSFLFVGLLVLADWTRLRLRRKR